MSLRPRPRSPRSPRAPLGDAAVPLQVVTTGLAEGPGWRDFALVRHQRRHGPLVGTLILGVLWAAWHFPLFLTEWGAWMGGADPMAVLQFVAFCVVLSVVVTWVFNRTNGSLPLAIVAHVSNSTFVQVESTKDIPMTCVPRTVLCWTAPCPASRERLVCLHGRHLRLRDGPALL